MDWCGMCMDGVYMDGYGVCGVYPIHGCGCVSVGGRQCTVQT